MTWTTWDANVLKIIEPSKIISFAHKNLGDKKVQVRAVSDFDGYEPDKINDEQLIRYAWDVLDRSDIVIGHHSNKFDLPKLNARFVYYGLNAPSHYESVDTKAQASRHFKFDSNSLNNLGHYLGVGKKIENGGFDLWLRCIAGEPKAWKLMKEYNCLTPDHKLLGTDLRWKRIDEFQIGDKILGFDENGPTRKFKESEITLLEYAVKPVYKVTLESGHSIKTTADHKWLVVNHVHDRVGGFKWKTTEDLFVNGKSISGKTTKSRYQTDVVPKFFNVWEEDFSKDAGWLAGMFDGESCVYNGGLSNGGIAISIAQKEGPELEKIKSLTSKFCKGGLSQSKIDHGTGFLVCRQVYVRGNVSERLEFLGTIRPERLINKVSFDRTGRLEARNGKEKIVSVEYIGEEKIAILGTSTRTFVADGYPMHNCQDVQLLEDVYLKLRPFISHPNVNLITGQRETDCTCHVCQSKDVTKRGFSFTKTGRKQRYQCNDCGSWSTGSFQRDKTEDDASEVFDDNGD